MNKCEVETIRFLEVLSHNQHIFAAEEGGGELP